MYLTIPKQMYSDLFIDICEYKCFFLYSCIKFCASNKADVRLINLHFETEKLTFKLRSLCLTNSVMYS